MATTDGEDMATTDGEGMTTTDGEPGDFTDDDNEDAERAYQATSAMSHADRQVET